MGTNQGRDLNVPGRDPEAAMQAPVSLPTREQIADRKRIERLVERVGMDLDRDVYHATGQETDVRDLRLAVLALLSHPTAPTPATLPESMQPAVKFGDPLLLSQPTPTAEQRQIDVVPVPRMWLEALMPTLHKHSDAAMIETADRALDGTVARMVAAEPPRIEDMAPGTTFEYPERWTVVKNGTADAYARNKQNARFLDEFDPSTIRDVTPPAGA